MFERDLVVRDSSSVSLISYDHQDESLRVQFRNGGIYTYKKVPATVFGTLACCHSVGQTFNNIVREHYEFD